MTDAAPTGGGTPARATPDEGTPDVAGVRPEMWHLAGYGWRFARLLTLPRADRLLRLAGPRFLPAAARDRFLAMGLPAAMVDETLAGVRSVEGWADAWTGAAQRFMGEARSAGSSDDPALPALARQRAALCYHAAPFFARDDLKLARASRASAVTLFAQSVGVLLRNTRRVLVPWRASTLAGYLSLPAEDVANVPLVVLLNGATTAKEELILWRAAFLRQGLAVLALDWPGTGEAAGLGPANADHDDFTDGVFDLATHDRALDPTRVVLVGISLGGAMAVRAAAHDRRIAACVAVTPPYDARRWIDAASDVTYAPLATVAGGDEEVDRLAGEFALPGVIPRLRCPLLVLGAGRDLLVPPAEAVALAAAAGELATLVWYPGARHALFDAFPAWTEDTARWLGAVLDVGYSTQVDQAAMGQEGKERTEAARPPAAEREAGGTASPDAGLAAELVEAAESAEEAADALTDEDATPAIGNDEGTKWLGRGASPEPAPRLTTAETGRERPVPGREPVLVRDAEDARPDHRGIDDPPGRLAAGQDRPAPRPRDAEAPPSPIPASAQPRRRGPVLDPTEPAADGGQAEAATGMSVEHEDHEDGETSPASAAADGAPHGPSTDSTPNEPSAPPRSKP